MRAQYNPPSSFFSSFPSPSHQAGTSFTSDLSNLLAESDRTIAMPGIMERNVALPRALADSNSLEYKDMCLREAMLNKSHYKKLD
jgi:hypothetical protein